MICVFFQSTRLSLKLLFFHIFPATLEFQKNVNLLKVYLLLKRLESVSMKLFMESIVVNSVCLTIEFILFQGLLVIHGFCDCTMHVIQELW